MYALYIRSVCVKKYRLKIFFLPPGGLAAPLGVAATAAITGAVGKGQKIE